MTNICLANVKSASHLSAQSQQSSAIVNYGRSTTFIVSNDNGLFPLKKKRADSSINEEGAINMMTPSLVGKTGFEPATPWSQTRCATGLRYFPKPSGEGGIRTPGTV